MDANRIRKELEEEFTSQNSISSDSEESDFEDSADGFHSNLEQSDSTAAMIFSAFGNARKQFENASNQLANAQQVLQQNQNAVQQQMVQAHDNIVQAHDTLVQAQDSASVQVQEAVSITEQSVSDAAKKIDQAKDQMNSSIANAKSKIAEANIQLKKANQDFVNAREMMANAREEHKKFTPFPKPVIESGNLSFGERTSFNRFAGAAESEPSSSIPAVPPVPAVPAIPSQPSIPNQQSTRAQRAKRATRKDGIYQDMIVTKGKEIVSSCTEDIMNYNTPKLKLKDAQDLDASFKQLEETYKMLESTGTVPASALENFRNALQDKKRVIDTLLEEADVESETEDSETASLTRNQSSEDQDDDGLLVGEEETEYDDLKMGKSKVKTEVDIRHNLKKLRGARVRQFYVKDTLYQLPGHIKVKWFELFLDLLYVGAISKAGKVIEHYEFTPTAIWRFALILTPLIFHWNYLAALNNSIHHNGMFRKVFTCAFMLVLIYMGISVHNAFDLESSTNTSGVFVAFHVATIILMESYIARAAKRSIPNIGIGAYTNLFWVLFQSGIYFAMYFFPADGTEDRLTFRQWIWTIGLLFELITFSGTDIYKSYYKQTRIGIHAEHLKERVGCFVLFVMGEIVVNLLTDYTNSKLTKYLLYVACSFVISINIFLLYFRVEGAKYFIHALHRKAAVWPIIWKFVHIPFSIAIVALGAANSQILKNLQQNSLESDAGSSLDPGTNDPHPIISNVFVQVGPSENCLRYVFCFAFVGVYFTLGLMGITHKEIVKPLRLPLINRNTRIKSRFLFGVLFVPIAFFDIGELNLMITGLVVTMVSVIFEELGRYGYHYRKGSGLITIGARTEETTPEGRNLKDAGIKINEPQRGRVILNRKANSIGGSE
ncbi:hypothetical protein HK103_000184 [Boothiomyces macroporosus]|uniref:Uncharacterized protein n=1 Tax=Boothiomyces macroporosus TaxID=261099 RepID=A0AAD5UN54_9FUNG|nr:hypothetical protein HK103_000184 [Boothiomyces macroporosus]